MTTMIFVEADAEKEHLRAMVIGQREVSYVVRLGYFILCVMGVYVLMCVHVCMFAYMGLHACLCTCARVRV